MFRSLLLFGLMSSLIAAGQTAGGQTGGAGGMTSGQPTAVVPVQTGTSYGGLVVNSGYVTTGVPVQGPVNPPLLSPPNIALPGSGPATGAPPNLDINNQRLGGTGDVVFPGAGAISPAENGSVLAPAAPAAARGDVVHNGVLNTGLGKFVSNPQAMVATAAQTPTVSLGDVARLYKARRATEHPKEFDNAKLEGRFDNTSQNNTVPQSSNEAPANEASQNQTAKALDQRDLARVEAELARSRAAAESNRTTAVVTPNAAPEENTTIAQATPPQNPSTSATTPQTPEANPNSQANAQNKKQLPATATPLPMLGLMGVLAAGVGAVYAFRSRT